jgi:hypothetical protein
MRLGRADLRLLATEDGIWADGLLGVPSACYLFVSVTKLHVERCTYHR